MDFSNIKLKFSASQNYIYLNNCGVSIVPDIVLEEVQAYLQEYRAHGILQKKYPAKVIYEKICQILAELFSVEQDEISLVHNTNEGFNFLSYGLSLKSGDEILLCEKEYPSNIYPWWHWQKKQVKIEYIPHSKSPEEFLQNFKKKLNEKVKVVSLSAVDWLTGMPYPLAEIGKICQENNILFAVDAAQGAGHVKIKPKEWHISFMAFSAWKWLWGPLGLAGIYVSKELLENLEPIFMGTGSVVQDENYLPYRSELKPSAERYVTSTASLVDWVWFYASLKLLQNLNFLQVQNKIYSLSAFFKKVLKENDFATSHDFFPSLPSGIISVLDLPYPDKVNQFLRQRGIVAALRDSKIRFSVHLCNHEEDLLKTAQVLREICLKFV